jgi:hypothetical protein
VTDKPKDEAIPIKIKRLTKEEADAIIERRRAKVRRARAEALKRLEAEILPLMHSENIVLLEGVEAQLAEKIIIA